jgi:hypothetical protein
MLSYYFAKTDPPHRTPLGHGKHSKTYKLDFPIGRITPQCRPKSSTGELTDPA